MISNMPIHSLFGPRRAGFFTPNTLQSQQSGGIHFRKPGKSARQTALYAATACPPELHGRESVNLRIPPSNGFTSGKFWERHKGPASRWLFCGPVQCRMQNELDNLLNSLLVEWHWWGCRDNVSRGYPTRDSTCCAARSSRQYDDQNGALDADIDDGVMEAFDHAAYRVPQPWLTALQFQAKNLSTGVSVWRSPRLPVDPEERAILTLEARNKLMRELQKDGVLS